MDHEHGSAVDRLDCPACRAADAAGARDVDLAGVWTGVAGQVWAPATGRLERLAARLLGSPALARALVTTPSLVPAWLVASAAVLAIGALVSFGVDTPVVPLIAPALAGAGLAFAYGPGTDPAHELAASTPVSDRMVLLVRAIVVFAVNAGMGVLASVLAPAAAGVTWSWLVPMTAVAALCLAAATVAGSAAVGMLVGLVFWATVVLATGLGTPAGVGAAVSTHPLLPVYLLLTLACAGIVLAGPALSRRRNGQLL